jgi:biopolymer transport protein ExbD
MTNRINHVLGGTDDDVDVTNLIDIMTVLAALLMIILPAYAALSADLAKVPRGDVPPDGQHPAALVRFSKSGELYWQDEAITIEQLGARVDSLKQGEARPVVLLAGDRDASYGFSVTLRTFLKEHGAQIKELAKLSEE